MADLSHRERFPGRDRQLRGRCWLALVDEDQAHST